MELNLWKVVVVQFLLLSSSTCDEDQEDLNEIRATNGSSPDKVFIEEIFDKYGHEGIITYEGFEHLLNNLGLGGGIFQQPHELELHRKNGSFLQIHDVNHRHKRHSDESKINHKIKHCLSPIDMLEMYGLESQYGAIINTDVFMHLCPALVHQLDQKFCTKQPASQDKAEDIKLAWIYAGLSILLISVSGLLGAVLIPVLNTMFFNQLLHFLIALAIGTLCGDAMLHLLPHALENEHTNEKHSHIDPIFKLSTTLLTILLFFCIESCMKMIVGNSENHGHSHNSDFNRQNIRKESVELDIMLPEMKKNENKKSVKPSAIMVVLGDALHNITDGLAIGAAFSNDIVTGFATAIAVFCHELPHELGDFAVLLKSGMSVKKAILYNVLSSILSFVGTAGGLWLGEDHKSSSQWIYAATAGSFLYIALVDLLPEITSISVKKICEFCLSVFGIFLGYLIMLSIALHEDSLVDLLK